MDVLYALKERGVTFSAEARQRITLIAEFEIFKFSQECAQSAFPQQEIERRESKIREETPRAWSYEHADWETSDAEMTPNPHLKRGRGQIQVISRKTHP